LPICWETLAVLFGQQKVSDASIGFSAITGEAQVLTEKAKLKISARHDKLYRNFLSGTTFVRLRASGSNWNHL